MISIVCACIPPYLRDGTFYCSLNSEEQDSEIQIPAQCYAENETIKDINDFAQLLRVTAFWGLHRIPQSIISFCDTYDLNEWDSLLKSEFAELPFATTLRTVFAERWQRGPFLATAIGSGINEIVEFLAAKYKSGEDAAGVAAQRGRLDYLKLLHQHGHPWGLSICENAVRGGNLRCLQYLHENGCSLSSTLYLTAATAGAFDCLKYLFEQGVLWDLETAERLTKHGRLQMLKYAAEHGCQLDETIMMTAADFGHLDCLQYLIDVRCPMAANTCYLAAENGHLDCLKLLHQHGSVWGEYTTEVAAQNGHLDCLMYLHENGCPWDNLVPAGAASRGHTDILRYAMERDCPYDQDILLFSIRADAASGFECLKYLIEERGMPLSVEGAEFVGAFIYGNHQALQYVIDQGCPYKHLRLPEICFIDHIKSIALQKDYYNMYDAKLVKCIECAVLNDWSLKENGTDLRRFVKSRAYRLPLCTTYLAT